MTANAAPGGGGGIDDATGIPLKVPDGYIFQRVEDLIAGLLNLIICVDTHTQYAYNNKSSAHE